MVPTDIGQMLLDPFKAPSIIHILHELNNIIQGEINGLNYLSHENFLLDGVTTLMATTILFMIKLKLL